MTTPIEEIRQATRLQLQSRIPFPSIARKYATLKQILSPELHEWFLPQISERAGELARLRVSDTRFLLSETPGYRYSISKLDELYCPKCKENHEIVVEILSDLPAHEVDLFLRSLLLSAPSEAINRQHLDILYASHA